MNRKLRVGDVFQIAGKKAVYIVVETAWTGGGVAMFNDRYPDGWQVFARRLNPDGSFNPSGRKIDFYQSSCYIGHMPCDITLLETRQMVVDFVSKKG